MPRKQLIEEIMASINVMKNKMHAKILQNSFKHNITHSQWFVLSIIQEHRKISVKEISKILGISSSATTQLIDGLAENHYVERKTDARDRRFLQLCLSKKGQKSIFIMKARYVKTMENLFHGLTDEELTMYLVLHKKILAQILNT